MKTKLKTSVTLTEASVKRERLVDGSDSVPQRIVWDNELTGFGLLVGKKTKTYIIQRRVSRSDKVRRIKIGRVESLTVKEARARALDIAGKLSAGIDVVQRGKDQYSEHTIGWAFDQYHTATILRKSTRRDHIYMMKKYLSDWMERPLSDIPNRDQARKIRNEILNRVQKSNGHATANYLSTILKSIYNYAINDLNVPGITKNPFKGLEILPMEKRKRWLRPSELPQFYNAVIQHQNPVVRDFVLLVLFTGLRKNEALELVWSEVDFKRRTINIPAHRMKANRDLTIPMSDFVHDLLSRRHSLGGAPTDYVFPSNSTTGHFVSPSYVMKILCKAAGIEPTTVHDLRRTYINHAARLEIPHYMLKILCNHASGDVTGNHYVNSLSDDLEDSEIRGEMTLRDYGQLVADKIKKYCNIDEARAVMLAA